MVKAIVSISDRANKMLNVIKAQYGLKDKSQAIDVMAKEYEEFVFEPKVRSGYLNKLKKIEKEGTVKVGSLGEFKERYGI